MSQIGRVETGGLPSPAWQGSLRLIIREIREHLPPSSNRLVAPDLGMGRFKRLSTRARRAWGILLANTDSLFDPETLRCFVAPYHPFSH